MPSVEEGVSLFASKEWASLYPTYLQAYQISGKGDHVIGSFLMFHKSSYSLRYSITAPFAPHIGLIAKSDTEKTESKQSFWKGIHEAIAVFIEAKNDALVEFCLSTDHIDSQPYTWKGFQVRPRHTYLLDLAQSAEEILAGMSPERRKNIRKAEDDGLKVEKTKDLFRFIRVIEKTIERQGIRMNKEIFNAILTADAIEKNRTLYICSQDGQDISAGLLVNDKERSYYLIGGYDPERSHEGAGALLLWQAMRDAKEKGNIIFDFEGSMIPEVERYFRGFGGKMHTFFSIEKKNWMARMATRARR